MVHTWCEQLYIRNGNVHFQSHRDKIRLIDGLDPFADCLGACRPTDAVPPVDASDLVSYLVLYTDQFPNC